MKGKKDKFLLELAGFDSETQSLFLVVESPHVACRVFFSRIPKQVKDMIVLHPLDQRYSLRYRTYVYAGCNSGNQSVLVHYDSILFVTRPKVPAFIKYGTS
jgi:hypothetical protein